MRKSNKVVALLGISILAVGLLTGCSGKKDDSSTASADTKVSTAAASTTQAPAASTAAGNTATNAPKKIVVGIGSTYNPFCYLDENGKQAGYDYEVLKAVDELLPQYEFDYEATEFKNILVGMDAGKYDIAAHHYAINEERKAKYLYSTVPNFYYGGYVFAAKKGRTDIKSLDDLQGKKVWVSSTSNVAYYLEDYNTKHTDSKIDIIYSDETYDQIIQKIDNGSYDGLAIQGYDVDVYNKAYGNKLEAVIDNILNQNKEDTGTYYIFRKGSEELQKAVDGALTQLRDSGKLSELSVKILGADYTK